MFSIRLCARFILCICCAVAFSVQAGDPILDPRIQLSGPKGQTVVMAVRYFQNQIAQKTVHQRVELNGTTETLGIGYDGILVHVSVPTSQPVRVILFDGDKELKREISQASGELELRVGDIPADDDLELPRSLPNAEERAFIEKFRTAVSTGQASELVSKNPLANIDVPTLNAYLQSLKIELGDPVVTDQPLDGWIGWDGSVGARVLSGTITFEHGACRFELMRLDELLVDVVVSSRQMPVDWLNEQPKPIDAYLAQAHQLIEALFAGQVERAHRLFSRRFQAEITPIQLAELCNSLSQQFGSGIQSLEFKRTEFGEVTVESAARRLSIDSVLVLNNGIRCIARVDFVFPVGQESIGRGHLASVDVQQAWQSTSPGQTELLTRSLRQVGQDDKYQAARTLRSLLHPQAAELITATQLRKFLSDAAQGLGSLQAEPDFDLWSAMPGTYPSATGPVSFANSKCLVQASFVEDKLLGLTLIADNLALSTLDVEPNLGRASQLGQEFWNELLHGKIEQAYSLLAPAFREQLTFGEFKRLATDAVDEFRGVRNVTVDALRIADRYDRQVPVGLVAYYLGEFEDGSYLPLSCEFVVGNGKAQLMSFSTDVQASFPVDAQSTRQRFLDAFLHGDAHAVIDLTRPELRESIDTRILTAFLTQLQAVMQNADAPQQQRGLREYARGRQFLRLRTEIAAPIGNVPVAALFEREQLDMFHFSHADVTSFVDRIDDTEGVNAHTGDLLQAWFAGNVEDTLQYFVSSLRTEALQTRLTSVRNEYTAALGAFKDYQTISMTPLPETNQLRQAVELHFENGMRPLQLTHDVNAFDSRVSAVYFTDGQ
ncbi:MAG: hypothetical protein R3C53_27035 [Pirellulaceae bacterium]